MSKKPFLKRQWSNILLLVLLALLIIPQTAMPIKVFFNRLISFSPSEIAVSERAEIQNYQWQLADLDGQSLNFQASKGKVVLVNFWATWCPPCVAEMPSLQNLYDAYGDEVDFYFVSQEAPGKLESFLEKKGYDLPVYIPKSQPVPELSSSSLPTTYLIDTEGRIVIRKTGAANWDSEGVKETIEGLLK